MKNTQVQKKLDNLANKFRNVKKFKADKCLDEVIKAMSEVGGITGITVSSGHSLTLNNHTASYNFPIIYEEHKPNMSKFAKQSYELLELMMGYLIEEGRSPADFEYHLGKDYSSKHHSINPYDRVA
ncbi:hypothetical protein KY334_00360 [Candidatus Woesearchaeota archaeon]|nr:hypothetical protein [Candidatus Woesearchaeota archaeon]